MQAPAVPAEHPRTWSQCRECPARWPAAPAPPPARYLLRNGKRDREQRRGAAGPARQVGRQRTAVKPAQGWGHSVQRCRHLPAPLHCTTNPASMLPVASAALRSSTPVPSQRRAPEGWSAPQWQDPAAMPPPAVPAQSFPCHALLPHGLEAPPCCPRAWWCPAGAWLKLRQQGQLRRWAAGLP